eukprot:m.346909 g.346909  ORF g.346909 m.346909 type:complete len:76 (-) comp27917_c5_seq1:956-1183(-)
MSRFPAFNSFRHSSIQFEMYFASISGCARIPRMSSFKDFSNIVNAVQLPALSLASPHTSCVGHFHPTSRCPFWHE